MDISKFLIDKYGYEPDKVNIMVKSIEALQSPFKEAFQKCMDSGIESSAGDYYGYSIERLMNEQGMNYPAALVTLDWISKEGLRAVKLLKRGKK